MGHIYTEIERAIRETGARVAAMSEQETAELMQGVTSRFGDPRSKRALWDQLTDRVSCRSEDGWRWISEFNPSDPCIMFVPPHLESQAFRFDAGRDVASVLAECSGFVVYIVGINLEYLLCFNDHEYLIASGTAKPWLLARCNE
jgi:hypothetical protein